MSAEQDEPSSAASFSRPDAPGTPSAPHPGDVHVAGAVPASPAPPDGTVPPVPPSGAMPPGGFVPPGGPVPAPAGKGGRRGPRRLRIMAAAGTAAVVVAAGAGAAVTLGGDEKPVKKTPKPTVSAPPPAWTIAAGRALTSGTGLRYDGTMTLMGRPVQAHLRATPAGSVTGTLVAGTLTADVVAIDGVTYLKAGLVFWRDYAGDVAHPEYYADRWSKAPASVPGFDVPDVLGPKSIAKTLAKASAAPPTENVNGVRAYRIKTPGADYLVTAAAPYRLLAVRAAGQSAPRFSAAPVAAPGTLFAELRPKVAMLGGAPDPALRFTPGTLTFSNCDQNTNGCTVSLPATLSAPQGTVPEDARAAMRASIASRGKPLGSCTASGPVPADRALVLRCTVTSGLWRHWMRNALDNPGSYPYEAAARVVGQALDPADVPKLLARVDRERKAVLKPKPPTPGPSQTGQPSAERSPRPEVATSQAPGTP